MKAAVFQSPGVLEVKEVPVPKPRPGNILVKVAYCAICGSDLHRYCYPGFMPPGVIMGHEWSGTVAEVGEGVTIFAVGDRVARGTFPQPGENPDMPSALPLRYSAQQKGFGDLERPGAYAEYMEVSASRVVHTPEGVSDLEAALAEPLAVAVHAVRLTNVRLGDSALVMGAGPIGVFAMQCLKLCGTRAVYISEPALARAELARKLGANGVLNPRSQDIMAAMLEATNGVGPDVVLDAAGAPPTLQTALETVRQRGRVVVVSLCMEPSPVTTVDWVGREVELKAAYGSTARDWQISFDLLQRRLVQAELIVSSIISLDEIQPTFQALLRPSDQVQVVVKF